MGMIKVYNFLQAQSDGTLCVWCSRRFTCLWGSNIWGPSIHKVHTSLRFIYLWGSSKLYEHTLWPSSNDLQGWVQLDKRNIAYIYDIYSYISRKARLRGYVQLGLYKKLIQSVWMSTNHYNTLIKSLSTNLTIADSARNAFQTLENYIRLDSL